MHDIQLNERNIELIIQTPRLCLTILLCFAYSLYHARLQTRPSYCKVFLQS